MPPAAKKYDNHELSLGLATRHMIMRVQNNALRAKARC